MKPPSTATEDGRGLDGTGSGHALCDRHFAHDPHRPEDEHGEGIMYGTGPLVGPGPDLFGGRQGEHGSRHRPRGPAR
jgi:hypothetical protein